jgi:outer membrane protein
MRRNGILLAVLAAAMWLAGPAAAQQFENVPQATPATQQAAPGGGTRVGVINVQLAMASTQEGRKALEDLRAQFAPRESELQKLTDEIRDLDGQIRAQERTLSEDARANLARQLESKRKQYTRQQQDLQEDVEAARNDVINRIGQKMQAVVTRYAQEQNLGLLLDGQVVVFALPSVDITEPVVKLYDQTHPVQAAANPAAAPATKPGQPAAQRPGSKKPNP